MFHPETTKCWKSDAAPYMGFGYRMDLGYHMDQRNSDLQSARDAPLPPLPPFPSPSPFPAQVRTGHGGQITELPVEKSQLELGCWAVTDDSVMIDLQTEIIATDSVVGQPGDLAVPAGKIQSELDSLDCLKATKGSVVVDHE